MRCPYDCDRRMVWLAGFGFDGDIFVAREAEVTDNLLGHWYCMTCGHRIRIPSNQSQFVT